MIKRLNGLKKFAEESSLSRSFLVVFRSLQYNYCSILFGYHSDIIRILFVYSSYTLRKLFAFAYSLFILCFPNISVSPEKEYVRL